MLTCILRKCYGSFELHATKNMWDGPTRANLYAPSPPKEVGAQKSIHYQLHNIPSTVQITRGPAEPNT